MNLNERLTNYAQLTEQALEKAFLAKSLLRKKEDCDLQINY